MPQIRSPHFINFRVGQTPPHDRAIPRFMHGTQFCTQISSGTSNFRREQLVEGEGHKTQKQKTKYDRSLWMGGMGDYDRVLAKKVMFSK